MQGKYKGKTHGYTEKGGYMINYYAEIDENKEPNGTVLHEFSIDINKEYVLLGRHRNRHEALIYFCGLTNIENGKLKWTQETLKIINEV